METSLTSTAPRTLSLKSLSPHGFHRVVYYEWGAADNPRVVICVHGVGRNGRDFDVLGEALASTHRVLAPDMPGRGQSDWLLDPNDYVFPTYLTALTALIAASGAPQVAWVGTSMGGLLGMVMAAQPNTPLTRLVVNDVGPVVEPAALARIADYFGKDPTFATFPEIEAYIRTISAPFGPLTDEQWALGAGLRPWDRDPLPQGAGTARPLASLGGHPLPDTGAPRCGVGSARRGYRAGYVGARSASASP